MLNLQFEFVLQHHAAAHAKQISHWLLWGRPLPDRAAYSLLNIPKAPLSRHDVSMSSITGVERNEF
jgi:hypothetical protein